MDIRYNGFHLASNRLVWIVCVKITTTNPFYLHYNLMQNYFDGNYYVDWQRSGRSHSLKIRKVRKTSRLV